MNVSNLVLNLFIACMALLSCESDMEEPQLYNSEPDTVRFLALGDSYTIGQSVEETERWPNQLSDSLEDDGIHIEETKIIARTGWRTDNLMDAIRSDTNLKNFNLVSLLIGVNNQYQGRSSSDYAVEFEELLDTAIALAGGNKDRVFVISIPDYGSTPVFAENGEAIGRAIDIFNGINEEITREKGISYYNITPISRTDPYDLSLVTTADKYHPSGKQYSLWVQQFYDQVLQKVR